MDFDVTVEIPKGNRNKYEVDHATGRIRLDRTLPRAVGDSRRDANGAAAADSCGAQRLFRRREIGRDHKTGAATLRQSCKRNFRIALCELIPGQENEVGTVRA